MAHSLAQIYVHVIFSTKDRLPLLAQRELRLEVHRYLSATCRGMGSPALEVGGVDDHVHVACRLSRTMAVSDLVRRLKRESSRWIKAREPSLDDFAWQSGYGAFSVSPRHIEAVRLYISNQEAHHRKETVEVELRRLEGSRGST